MNKAHKGGTKCFFFCWLGTTSLFNGKMNRQETPKPFYCHKTLPATAQWLNTNVYYFQFPNTREGVKKALPMAVKSYTQCARDHTPVSGICEKL